MYCLNIPKKHFLLGLVVPGIYLITLYALVPNVASSDTQVTKNDSNFPKVDHHDAMIVENDLSLSKVIDLTLEKYPDATWLSALEEEAAALAERSQSWTAGASQASVGYQSISSFKLNYGTANVQVPLWNLGQRHAQSYLANKAETSAAMQAVNVKLRVAGLVRGALWAIALANIRYEQAKAELAVYEKLLVTIKHRVESGDLPKTDDLLAQTELLQKRSVYTLAEAELMHARKRYSSITQLNKIPASFEESLAPLKELGRNHPSLIALNSQIDVKQAELTATKAIGSGQTNIVAGLLSDEGNDYRSNKAEFFNVGVSVPFGGSAHTQPHIAAINVELNRLIAEREQLHRDLEQAHHEAEHNLEVNEVELGNANEQRKVSEQLLSMTELAFSVGEISLMDLLKIQSRTQQAILTAKERVVMMQRDKALYNQSVGLLP